MHEKGFKLGGEWTVERLASRKNNQMSSKGFRATLILVYGPSVISTYMHAEGQKR